MNLAEYPIALLADRAPDGIKTVVYHDKDETLTITGSDLLGLPTALDVDVIIGLLHLTKQKSNFESVLVNFTRYELIKILGWPDRGFYYERLTESLNRWVGVMLIYKKAWWDNRTKTKGNLSFHILDSVNIVDQEQRRGLQSRQIQLPLSTVRWSSDFFRSFQANNIKKLDLKVYFSLESAISKQLYRFLDKRFYNRSEWSFDLRTLACEHVGMSRNYECWRLKQKLQPAIDELTSAGFLKPLAAEKRFKKTGKGQWTVSFQKAGPSAAFEDVAGETPEPAEPSRLEQELVGRGVTRKTALELIAAFPEERIELQMEQADWLKKNGKQKIANLGAYLTKAIRDDYARPAGFVTKAEKAEQQRAENQRRKLEQAAARRDKERAKQRAEDRAKVELHWKGLSESEQGTLKADALAQADAEHLRVYNEMQRGRFASTSAEVFFRVTILDPHIRKLLGLPPEESVG